MSDQSKAVTDQLRAHVRDLTPGQRVEFALAMFDHIEKNAQRMAASGLQPLAGPIGLASSLGIAALVDLRETVPGECVADVLAAINGLVYPR